MVSGQNNWRSELNRKMKIIVVCALCLVWWLPLGAQSNANVDFSRGRVSQQLLDSFGRGAVEGEFKVNMSGSSPLNLPNYFVVRDGGHTHGGKKDIVMGKLFAVSDSGVFLYRSATSQVRYVPYSKMDYIMKGRPLRKRLVVHGVTEMVGWTGFVVYVAWDDYYIGGPSSVAIGAVLGFVAGGIESLFWTTVYGIRKQNANILINIHCDPLKGREFQQQLKSNHSKLWEKVNLQNFPSVQ